MKALKRALDIVKLPKAIGLSIATKHMAGQVHAIQAEMKQHL